MTAYLTGTSPPGSVLNFYLPDTKRGALRNDYNLQEFFSLKGNPEEIVDENGDRERQPWEDGIPDIPIFLDGRFVSVTDAKGEFEFENVLIGKHKLSIEMQALPLDYLPAFIQKEVEIQVRKTTEIFFPAKRQ